MSIWNELNEYFRLLGYDNMPSFLFKYLKSNSLIRLKNVGYFCGMDYASKDIYDFGTYVSRFDHSLTVALLTWKLTNDINITLAALFHDISTPCFSHVIDYMNKDYNRQESTEMYIEKIIINDEYLINSFKNDEINIDDIVNFKKYSIVDLDRPMLCSDRLDGIILNSLFWTKNMNICEVEKILNSIQCYNNENNVLEVGFNNMEVAKMIIEKNNLFDIYSRSKEDNYMMELLANITKIGIEKGYFSYDELYYLSELELIKRIITSNDIDLLEQWHLFKTIKKEEVVEFDLPFVKKKIIKPIVNGKRVNV